MFRNLTLAALQEPDRSALRPFLAERTVEKGETLTPQGGMVEQLYFPVTAYLANMVTFSDGRSAETFVMGREGVSGLAAFLADEPCAWSVEVKTTGEVYAVSADVFRRRFEQSPELRRQMLVLAYRYQAQAAVGAACASLHDLPSRLARLLLTSADLTRSELMAFTQEDIAQRLGAQRTSVSGAAHELKEAHIIRYSRGVIRIIDREKLKRSACECYSLLGWPAPASAEAEPARAATV